MIVRSIWIHRPTTGVHLTYLQTRLGQLSRFAIYLGKERENVSPARQQVKSATHRQRFAEQFRAYWLLRRIPALAMR